MNRREFLKAVGWAALLPTLPHSLWASTNFRRRRPSDANWPSLADWKRLNDAVGGNLVPVNFPLSTLRNDPRGIDAARLLEELRSPYYIGDQAGLTQTLGWVDAWTTEPSVYAVAARSVHDIVEAVNFARKNDLRLVIKGGGHSYQGTSNSPDSLLIWTRHVKDITTHPAFVPQGCEETMKPQPAVTMGAGAIWMQAYQDVTTNGGKYVQGGGCTTVGVAGLVQSGGFGSHSKHYGTAAGSLLEAEVVTADGQIRIANSCTNPDLFWALKGGGGGTFGVISKLTLRLHDLPEFFGVTSFTIKAASDDAYRRLIREFVTFYAESLFNDHWGETAHFRPDNRLGITMVSQGLDTEQAKEVWQPFLDWVKRSSSDCSLEGHLTIGSLPARHQWDVQWLKEHWAEVAFPKKSNPLIALLDWGLVHLLQPIFNVSPQPGAGVNDIWWKGDAGQVGWFIWGFQSLWLPASLLEGDSQQRLADALFTGSRSSGVSLQFNKGLAGAPPDALARAKDTATNPAVQNSFALAIAADAQGPAMASLGKNRGFAYPGIPGHEPSVAEARESAKRIERCVAQLRTVAGETGAYVSESNYFEKDWQHSYWGSNYQRLAQIKQKYDPEGLFFVHNGVGSEQWNTDGFTKL
jgi:FAD/FMN-containing dehydrogenase